MDIKNLMTPSMDNLRDSVNRFLESSGDVELTGIINNFKSVVDSFRKYPLGERDEFFRAFWLDSQKWMALKRISELRVMKHWIVGDIIFSTNYNPWCNFCLVTGKNCRECPVYLARKEEYKEINFIGVNNFLMCKLAHPEYSDWATAVGRKDFALFKKIIKKNIESGLSEAIRSYIENSSVASGDKK